MAIAACLLPSCLCAEAAEWQWSISVKGGVEKSGPARAFLWIPPACDRVRGVVLAQHNMEEIVKVTVVAWQYGRSIEPRLKTADPVVRSFLRIH